MEIHELGKNSSKRTFSILLTLRSMILDQQSANYSPWPTGTHGPQGPLSLACFYTACELRMAFTILNGWGKNQNKNNILWPIKMI